MLTMQVRQKFIPLNACWSTSSSIICASLDISARSVRTSATKPTSLSSESFAGAATWPGSSVIARKKL